MDIQRPLSQIMTTQIISIGPLELISKVSSIFDNHKIHHLPILNEKGIALGMISKHDFRQVQHHFTCYGWEMAEASNNHLFSSLIAKDVMSKDLVTLREDDSIEKAISYFLQNRVHSILITDSNNYCLGIVTPYDILKEVQGAKQYQLNFSRA